MVDLCQRPQHRLLVQLYTVDSRLLVMLHASLAVGSRGKAAGEFVLLVLFVQLHTSRAGRDSWHLLVRVLIMLL